MEDLLCFRYRMGARITLPDAPVGTEDCCVPSHVLDRVWEELIASIRWLLTFSPEDGSRSMLFPEDPKRRQIS
jgi:hypothetical protein